ncbi:hypothetical protein QTO34_017175 [Cnephaeus nilssonii]|uniref:Uncharacterized protein n=1 Tax=Cnephaeus nilssonii TaxID=3371016 RepID=A0AA40I0H4_CNENI|nr:hypothetical protein QTO34_017175 [Eptesicus nilssonii]
MVASEAVVGSVSGSNAATVVAVVAVGGARSGGSRRGVAGGVRGRGGLGGGGGCGQGVVRRVARGGAGGQVGPQKQHAGLRRRRQRGRRVGVIRGSGSARPQRQLCQQAQRVGSAGRGGLGWVGGTGGRHHARSARPALPAAAGEKLQAAPRLAQAPCPPESLILGKEDFSCPPPPALSQGAGRLPSMRLRSSESGALPGSQNEVLPQADPGFSEALSSWYLMDSGLHNCFLDVDTSKVEKEPEPAPPEPPHSLFCAPSSCSLCDHWGLLEDKLGLSKDDRDVLPDFLSDLTPNLFIVDELTRRTEMAALLFADSSGKQEPPDPHGADDRADLKEGSTDQKGEPLSRVHGTASAPHPRDACASLLAVGQFWDKRTKLKTPAWSHSDSSPLGLMSDSLWFGLGWTQGHCFTRIQGPTASPGPGARLTRIQGPVASPGPGAQGSPGSRGPRPRPDPGPRAHPDPGARGLARTRGPGLTRIQGPAASPGPGAQGSPGSRGPRPRPDPGPRAHPDPGARGLARTRGPGLTRIQGPAASPGPGAQGSPGSRGTRPRPDPGFSLTRTQGRTASPRPRIQPHPDPGAHGLARTQGHVASPGPGAQRGFVFLIPIPVGQFPLSNSFGHFLRVPGQPPQNSLGGGLGEAPECPVRGGGLVRGGCVGPWVCSGGRSPSVRTWPLPGC